LKIGLADKSHLYVIALQEFIDENYGKLKCGRNNKPKEEL
jgi:hypothetical protein